MIEIATLLIALATFLVAFLTLYIMVSKPRVRVYFWDRIGNKLSNKSTLAAGQIKTLSFLFRNEGDFLGLWNPAVTMLTDAVAVLIVS